ncbi:MAG: NUDIX domain-containing protein [Anaerolineaceae bacterium]|nr:NUDIX domain-containing protein [Anaerolineaceae bacterium]
MGKNKQKILPGRYQVVPRTLIFIRNNDKVLLIKGAKDKKIWPGLYNGIGGHIERGEDVLSAAHRELFEETGLKNIQLDLRAIIFIDVEEYQGISMFVFLGNSDRKVLVSSEEGFLDWIKIDQIQNYPLVEDLYQLITMVLSTENTVQFGRYYYCDGQLVMEFI